MYKTKETAIRNLQRGRNFGTKPFSLFRNDRKVVLEAIKINPEFIMDSDKQFRDDRNIMLYVWKRTPELFMVASRSIKSDKKYCLEVAKHQGILLEYMSDELRADKEIVLMAVRQSKWSLQYASPEIQELCKDKDPVFALEAAIRMEKMQEQLKLKSNSPSHSPKLKM